MPCALTVKLLISSVITWGKGRTSTKATRDRKIDRPRTSYTCWHETKPNSNDIPSAGQDSWCIDIFLELPFHWLLVRDEPWLFCAILFLYIRASSPSAALFLRLRRSWQLLSSPVLRGALKPNERMSGDVISCPPGAALFRLLLFLRPLPVPLASAAL